MVHDQRLTLVVHDLRLTEPPLEVGRLDPLLFPEAAGLSDFVSAASNCRRVSRGQSTKRQDPVNQFGRTRLSGTTHASSPGVIKNTWLKLDVQHLDTAGVVNPDVVVPKQIFRKKILFPSKSSQPAEKR